MGGVVLYGVRPLPLAVVFSPLFKISFGNPYLKILNLSKLFVSDVLMKKKIYKFSFTPSQSNMVLKIAHA